MNNRFLVSVAVLALITGTGVANAQGTGGHESGGAQVQSAPSSAGGSAASGASTENRESSKGVGTSSGMKAEQKSPTGGQNQRAEENAPGAKSKSMSSEDGTRSGAKGMKAEGRANHNENMNAESREGRMNMNAETKTGNQGSQVTTGQAGASAKLSTDQRTKITTIIRNEHVAPANDVDFAVSIGTRVPREHVSLRPLPADVVGIYPEWRGYEFFLARDEIIVVDPRTLEIVAVLPA